MENLNKRPSKGILRFSEGSSRSNSVEKDIKWDEANIKETLHPDDKDYGFMRIDEPPTPYSRSPHGHSGEESDEDDSQAKTNDLLERVSRKIKEPPVTIENVENLGLDESELEAIEKQDLDDETMNGASLNSTTISEDAFVASTSHQQSPSELSSRTAMIDDSDISRASGSSCNVSDFELKRKRHYNEFHAVRLAKKLMQKELDDKEDDDDDDDEDKPNDDHEDEHNNDGGHQHQDHNTEARGESSSGNEQTRQKNEDVCFEESST